MLHIVTVACLKHKDADGISRDCNRYSMTYRGELLGGSESPLCDAARILLARGLAEPGDQIGISRDGARVDLSGSVKWASEHVAKEDRKRSPHFEKWRQLPAFLHAGFRQDGG